MRPPEEARQALERWLALADLDLETVTLTVARDDLAPVSCYHAHQAAEKALKGYLAWLSPEDIPYTHNLLRLAQLLSERGGALTTTEGLVALNLYPVATRYGDPNTEPPLPEDAVRAVQMAREVVEDVRSRTERE